MKIRIYLIDEESKIVEGNEFQTTPEQSSSKKENTLSLPNHNGSHHILAYLLPFTHLII